VAGRGWLRIAIVVTSVKQRHSKVIRRSERGKEIPVEPAADE
jgi:hypothetical protein